MDSSGTSVLRNHEPENREAANESSLRKVTQVFHRLEEWVNRQGLKGYDPYDLQGHPLFLLLLKPKWRVARKVAARVIALTERAPFLVRKAFGIRKAINAKGVGLLAAAYANYARATGDSDFRMKAIQCAEWLIENPSPGHSGLCWGYPFNWQWGPRFLPRGTPSGVISTTVGDGLWRLAELTDEERFWDACGSICEFLLNDLNTDSREDGTLCFSYTPLDRTHVHNANLLIAEFLARVGRKVERASYLEAANAAGQFAVKEQRPDGSLIYFGSADNKYNPGHRDVYHSGFEIRALWGLWKATGNDDFRRAASRYLDYFYNTYIREGGAVWRVPHNQFPVDIHGCAEALLCPAALRELDLERFERTWPDVLDWTVSNMQNPDGSFAYKRYADGRICRIAFFRWGQAWMMRALSEIVLATGAQGREEDS